MASRKEIHIWDVTQMLTVPHKPPCLAAHASWFAMSNTCSYRGQAYHKATEEANKSHYLYPYDPADKQGPPKPGVWDIGLPGNYKRRGTVPIWHEAHHIVTNGELNAALNGVGGEDVDIKKMVRGGLLTEGYNLNDKLNMIILPMRPHDSKKLNLPLHRQTYQYFHEVFSAHIESELDKVMQPMKDKAKQCQLTDYEKIRKKIEDISNHLYPQIRDAGPVFIDQIKLTPVPAAEE